MDDTLLSVVVGGNETDAVGRVDTVGSIVQVDADLGILVFRVEELFKSTTP